MYVNSGWEVTNKWADSVHKETNEWRKKEKKTCKKNIFEAWNEVFEETKIVTLGIIGRRKNNLERHFGC